MGNNKKTISLISVLLAAALWGTAGIFVRSINGALSEMQLVFGRALITSALIAVIMLVKDKRLFKIKLKDFYLFALLGIASIVAFNFCYYKTMSLASLSVAAVLLYTAPFFVIIISALFFKEKITLKKSASLLVAFVGCLFVSGVLESGTRLPARAIMFGLLTGLGYGLYTVFDGMLIRKGYSTFTINFYAFLIAAVACLPLIGISGVKSICSAGAKNQLIVVGMALFNTVIPYLLYSFGLKAINGSNALIMATLEPVVATLVGTFVFKEKITLYGIIGVLLVLSAVVILNIGNKGKNTITLKAFAKINLSLYITGKREDGYHTLDGVMQSVGICDTVKIKNQNTINVVCRGLDIPQSDNIAFKAAKAFFAAANLNGGCKIIIKKNIPAVAGLGGGSADAAAVLVGLNELYGNVFTNEELVKIAVKIGADVPFFINGGTARAEGIGEILTPLKAKNNFYYVIALCDSKISTKEMYNKVDSMPYLSPKTEALITALNKGDFAGVARNCENCFGVFYKNSKIIKFALDKKIPCCLSGSGPSFFMMLGQKRDAEKTCRELKQNGIKAFIATPKEKGICE